MKKVTFITNTFPVDNRLIQGRFNYKAALLLSKEADIVIYHIRSWKPFRKISYKRKIGELEINVFSFPYYPIRFKRLLAFQLLIYKKVFYFITRRKLKQTDVLHSVGASFASVVTSYLAKKMQKPHIAQCIGTDVNYNLPNIKEFLGVEGFDKNVSYFIANSEALQKQVLRLYPEAKTDTIYRGVNLDYFYKSDFGTVENVIEFTYMGGLSMRKETGLGRDYKGGMTLLKAWKSLKTSDNLRLNFAGPEVDEELVNEILGVQSNKLNIKVYGQLEKKEVRDLLNKTDIVVIPSWAEGLPNVGMEALASYCAILGSNVGGIPELIDENGYLFEAGNSEELKNSLIKISSDQTNLNKMKDRSRYFAEKKFDDKNFTKKYLVLYAKL